MDLSSHLVRYGHHAKALIFGALVLTASAVAPMYGYALTNASEPDDAVNVHWEPSPGSADHYRLEVVSYSSPDEKGGETVNVYYAETNKCSVNLDCDNYNAIRVCAVDRYGRTSEFSEEIVLQPGFAARIAMQSDDKPTAFSLSQNSPNPFNASTTLSFTIPDASKVTLKIYNTAGQLVDTLIQSNLPQGAHTYIWKPEGLSSGNYMYVLETPSGRAVGKMMYLK